MNKAELSIIWFFVCIVCAATMGAFTYNCGRSDGKETQRCADRGGEMQSTPRGWACAKTTPADYTYIDVGP